MYLQMAGSKEAEYGLQQCIFQFTFSHLCPKALDVTNSPRAQDLFYRGS